MFQFHFKRKNDEVLAVNIVHFPKFEINVPLSN